MQHPKNILLISGIIIKKTPPYYKSGTNKGGFLINLTKNLNFERSYQKSGTNKGGFSYKPGFS